MQSDILEVLTYLHKTCLLLWCLQEYLGYINLVVNKK